MVYFSRTIIFIFFFKQKTAYEMRISDWSSDVCSSDLPGSASSLGACCVARPRGHQFAPALEKVCPSIGCLDSIDEFVRERLIDDQIGRASCRERVCQYV